MDRLEQVIFDALDTAVQNSRVFDRDGMIQTAKEIADNVSDEFRLEYDPIERYVD
jgi:hypothetical protein